MKRYDNPIITSLLDTDAYKLHMQQAVYHHYRETYVSAEFRCRGEDLLGHYADEIRQQIDAMQSLTLQEEELTFLSALPFFSTDYLLWLKNFRFKPQQVSVENRQGKLHLSLSGPWVEVILWEIPLLALISEVVHRHRTPDIGAEQAAASLESKLARFNQAAQGIDLSRFRVMDFGTRRRYSQQVQHTIVKMLQQQAPWLCGTSNYDLARRLALSPVGTQAHEWFQAHQQLSPELADSQRAALQVWLQEYPEQLGIALTDCISTDAFLRDFEGDFARRYQGLRHDSGDPVLWGEKVIRHYRSLGIDPQTKTLVFSDNLRLDKALSLYRHFDQHINLSFGIGTRLTCDIPGVTPLNIVIKLVSCNGKPVAKLSDSPGKTICQDTSFVRELEAAFALPVARRAS